MSGSADPSAMAVVSKSECARRLGVTPKTITVETRPDGKLAPALTGDNRIDMTVAERLWADRRDTSKGSTGGQVLKITDDDRGLKAAKRRIAEAQADSAEADRLVRLGGLVDREAYDRQVYTRLRALRDMILAVPADAADEIAAKSDPREIRALLSARLRRVLEGFVDDAGGAGADVLRA